MNGRLCMLQFVRFNCSPFLSLLFVLLLLLHEMIHYIFCVCYLVSSFKLQIKKWNLSWRNSNAPKVRSTSKKHLKSSTTTRTTTNQCRPVYARAHYLWNEKAADDVHRPAWWWADGFVEFDHMQVENMLSLPLSLFSVCVGQVRCRWIIDFFVFQLPKRNKQIHNLFECKEIELSLSHLQLTDRLVSRWQWHTCRTTKKLQEKVADHRP